ncbi:MAG: M1 family aminopeptidase [Candidatus Cloacimonadota bacterium]|nr:M1 family aminopeptidase [Candidatus Cloacimonadota bacterium]
MKKILVISIFMILISTLSYAEIPRDLFHKTNSPAGFFRMNSRADSLHSYDALSYEINLQIFPSDHSICGNVLAKIQSKENNLTEVSYELEQLNVDSVFVNGTLADFTYDDHIVTIELDQGYNLDDTLSTRVYYQGFPTQSNDVYNTGIYWQNHIFTYSDPNGARYWWAGYDHPWDKAFTKLNLRVPEDMLVAANGILVDEIVHGDGTKTFFWNNTDKIATYLVSFSTGNYETFEQTYEDLPLINYVYPYHLSSAQNDFACVPTALGVYENHFGEYPFQKYGMAECGIFGGLGGMEHQTMTSIGSGLITGTGTYELIFVHELGHQWFGDCLTPLTWKDVWLSEGFATYSEALYVEATQGFEAMCNYVYSSYHTYYLNWAGSNNYTIYDPPYSSYFTPATYEKPASVLHMLRLMVGNETFFEILQTYVDEFKYGCVITPDFVEVCESVSGMELEEYFEGWIYGSGIPNFEYYFLKTEIDNEPGLIFLGRSQCSTQTSFTMQIPLFVEIDEQVDSVLIDVENEFVQTDCSYLVQNFPGEISVEYDPHNWILDRGHSEKRPALNGAYPGDGQVILFWEEFDENSLFDDWDYKIYRKTESQNEYEEIMQVQNATSCLDETAENGESYDYVISAYHFEAPGNLWETGFSNSINASPIPFPMEDGILLVDETRDGNGTPANPDDATVDSFYTYVLQGYEVTEFDYVSQSPLDLETLSHYSTIIWIDDDASQNYIGDEINKLCSVILSGGHVHISGWKTVDYIPDSFLNDFAHCGSAQLIPELDFLGGIPEDDYPYIDVNGDIIPQLGDKWMYVGSFSDAENVLYRYDSDSGAHADIPVGVVNDMDDKNTAVLGFPLYFMNGEDVTEYFEHLLTDFGEESGVGGQYNHPVTVLHQNFPNPFSSTTKIEFNLKQDLNNVSLKIFNLKGQLVKECTIQNDDNGTKLKNNYTIWDGKNKFGKMVSSGIYLYKLETDNSFQTRKMLLVR